MATLPALDPTAPTTARVAPLSTADEQAAILKATARSEPDGGRLELDEDLVLEAWERELLYREARWSRGVRGEALTLLHARAAEWAVRRSLRQGLDLAGAEGAALLLDRTLADIGSATDYPGCRCRDQLEALAGRLHDLYERLAATSLKLAGRHRLAPGEEGELWRLEALRGDEFEIETGESRGRRPTRHPVAVLEPESDGFEILGLDAMPAYGAGAPIEATAPRTTLRPATAILPDGPAPAPADEGFAFELGLDALSLPESDPRADPRTHHPAPAPTPPEPALFASDTAAPPSATAPKATVRAIAPAVAIPTAAVSSAVPVATVGERAPAGAISAMVAEPPSHHRGSASSPAEARPSGPNRLVVVAAMVAVAVLAALALLTLR